MLLVLLSFLLGIAFSRALDERPHDGELVTTVRTLGSAGAIDGQRTVTVTVTVP